MGGPVKTDGDLLLIEECTGALFEAQMHISSVRYALNAKGIGSPSQMQEVVRAHELIDNALMYLRRVEYAFAEELAALHAPTRWPGIDD